MLPPRLSELDVLVLSYLHQRADHHGYSIVQELEGYCSQSAVYRSLRRLEAEKLVTRTCVHQDKVPNRHLCAITPKGLAALRSSQLWQEDLEQRALSAGRSLKKLHWLLQFKSLC